MRVLLTGGTGFIGRAIAARLEADGHSVKPFDHSHGLDVRDANALRIETKGADAVIHLAGVLGTAELLDDLRTAIDVNVTGTANVLTACRDADVRYIGITMPDCWPSVYQATKLAGVRIARAFENAYGLSQFHVRTFNVYGPGQAHGPGHPQKIVPTFAVAAHRGEPLPIWGNGENTVDLVHVDDVAHTFSEVLAWGDKPLPYDTIDCGSGMQSSVNDVADAVCRAAGVRPNLRHVPMRAGELPGTYLAADTFGPFTPGRFWRHDPRFVETVEWYKDQA